MLKSASDYLFLFREIMKIWKKEFTPEVLNTLSKDCAVAHLGIQFSAFGDNWLEATMPIDHRTKQPWGILHGGISAALAETVGSAGSVLCVEENQRIVGLEINANHLRPVSEGFVTARATPIQLGRKIHVWQVDIRNQEDKLCCVSRLTLSVLNNE